jgi:hypothetical protein
MIELTGDSLDRRIALASGKELDDLALLYCGWLCRRADLIDDHKFRAAVQLRLKQLRAVRAAYKLQPRSETYS